ncbi:DUF1573 domain-containing protein [Flavicella sp.]|uniref:DUF1573 domain-containing protein n=1 Tax=Flavicella sp. TaxID=2957742 RepID=UPI0030175B85
MKKIILFLITVAFVSFSCKESAASKVKDQNIEKAKERDVKYENLPEISFDKKSFDFGVIDEGEVVETRFKILNVGKSDLIIKKASATCGCTVPDWPKEAIKSGKFAYMTVSFNSKGRRNNFSKTITLLTNTETGKETVKIKGFVNIK